MNINFNLNFDRLVKFNKAFWVKVGSWAIRQIRQDAGQGIFQTDEPWKKTYNKDYAELKENRMKKKAGYIQSGKNKGKVKRVKMDAYKGVSIVSTNTSFVDMTLTGQTLRGLHIVDEGATDKGVTISYQPRDLWKIVGNQRPGLNRRLVGLNSRNQKRLLNMFTDELTNKIIKDIVGRTTINIKI